MSRIAILGGLVILTACAGTQEGADKPKIKPALGVLEYSSYAGDPEQPAAAPGVLIRGATIMTAAGSIHENGHILMEDGLIKSVGKGPGPELKETHVIDGRGQYVTPGLIDTHSHMGVYPWPWARAHEDGNEMTGPTTPHIWAEHGFWPQDPAIPRVVAGGVTTVQVLPGSANLIGGRSYVAKLRPGTSARHMRFPGAPQGLKMACGENPKGVYGERGGPQTRMGNIAGFRSIFQKAVEYRRSWEKFDRDLTHWKDKEGKNDDGDPEDPPDPPGRDFGMETLVKVLNGEIAVHNHCYRADEMHIMLDLSEEFGFTIKSFHHALEAYKLADRLAEKKVASSTWADWWGFKMEAFDGISQNAALLSAAGAITIIHSDSATELRHLNHEAQKARTAGTKVGLEIDDNETLRWITANPAWALGIDERTGTLEKGKMADVVLWDGHPFSVYTKAKKVFIDGHMLYDRETREQPRPTDFELGLFPAREANIQ